MKNKIILILAVVVGLAAAGGIYAFLDGLKRTYVVEGDFVKVVTARQRIPARTQVASQMIELKEIPAKYVNDRAAVDINEVTGKIVKSDILPGEQVLRDKLAKDKEDSDGLSFVVQPGKRAVTIAVNQVSGVAGLIKPGDRVDVFGTFDLQGQNQEKASVNSLLIQNVDVLSVDQSAIQTAAGQDAKKNAATASDHTITLQVTPEQAEPLILCSEKGTIRLGLRSATDQDIINLPSIRTNQLVR
ncbi:SAF domain protein [Pelotomaculum schinkii]|uniref:SAF domain protein n=1 Tax=Pelotomaculum schinkii TaxID=78350 RepID=A0A4Y7RDW3_9FIRM|nr:Flp pilus assembly protein CpaB [Pelotomaculum schinkii]TEB06996.1 SAF domain protein [Pelotomaculum schinkii]